MVFMDFSDEEEDKIDTPDDDPLDESTQPFFDVSTLPDLEPPPSEIALTEPGDSTVGTDGDDAITVDTGSVSDPGMTEYLSGQVQYYPDDESDPITTVDAGDGDDSIIVQSGVADITTGEGSDTVDASGLDGGVIRAGSGDLILGSNVAPDPNTFFSTQTLGVELHDDAEFRGGDAHEYVASFGDGATVDGGGGDDVILNFDGSATLSGGAGDDIIDAHAFADEYDQNTQFVTRTGDGFADLVDGGDGNDRIFVDGGDTVTGGEGLDIIQVGYQMGADSDPVTMTDYNSANDQVTLNISDFAGVDDGAGGLDFDPEGRVTILEGDGDSHVFVDSELVAVLENTGGVTATMSYHPEDPESQWHGLRIQLGGTAVPIS